MSEQNSLQVASGDAIEDVTNTPANNNKKCSTMSMLLLGTGVVFVVVGVALGAYHAGTDTQTSAANSALDQAKEEIEGMFGDDEEQLAAIVDVLDNSAPLGGGTITFGSGTNVTVTVDAKSGKSASSKSKKKSSGTSSPTTDMLSGKAKSSKSGDVATSSPSTDGLPDGGGSSKSSKSDGGTASPTTDMLSGKAKSSKSSVVTTSSPSTDGLPDGGGSSKSSKSDGGTASPTTDMLKAKSSKSGDVATSSPSTDGLTTSSPTDSLPAGGGTAGGNLGVITPDIALVSLSQAEYSMSMFTRRQYN